MWIKIPMSYIGIGEIKYWFDCIAPKLASYRLIVDEDTDIDRLDIKEKEDLYPDCKIISVVMNPWARIRLSYLNLRKNKDSRANCSFNEFVKLISTNLEKISDKDKKSLKSQIDWLQYIKEDNSIREADYIFKIENLDEEFKVIQEYFNCYEPLKWFHTIPEYREYYNEESKSIVAEMFAKDIERFGYEF
jgi:hypothetical protein